MSCYMQVITYWADEFGLTQRETVAVLGAHTLGGMDEAGSGYQGNWQEAVSSSCSSRKRN